MMTTENNSQDSILIQLAKTAKLRWFKSGGRLYEPAVALYAIVAVQLFGALAILPLIVILAFQNFDQFTSLTAGESGLFLQDLLLGTPRNFALYLIITFAAIHFAVWLWLRLIERRGFWTLGFQVDWGTGLWQYGRGLLVGLGMILGCVGILALLGFVSWENRFTGFSGVVLLNVLLILIGFMVQGAAEEVLTRGLLMQVFGRRYGLFVGIFVSSVLFALLHLLNPNIGWISVLNLFLAGVLFAIYAIKEGSLWGACGFHSMWNWTMGNLLGFEVSGQTASNSDGTLFDLMETGPDWVTGGLFGPEGGVVVTAVALILIVLLLRLDSVTGEPS